jgi:hypothetical protein
MVETKNDTYIDDLTCETDYKIPLYFREAFNQNAEMMGTETYEQLFPIDNSDNINSDENYIAIHSNIWLILYLVLLIDLSI